MKKDARKIWKLFVIVFSILIFTMVISPTDIKAAESKGTEVNFENVMEVNYSPSKKISIDQNTLTIKFTSKVNGLQWKYYAAAPDDIFKTKTDNKDYAGGTGGDELDEDAAVDYSHFFKKNGEFRKNMTSFSNTTTKEVKFNRNTEVLLVFVTVDGKQTVNRKNYHECKLKFNAKTGNMYLERENGGTCTGSYYTYARTKYSYTVSNSVNNWDKKQCEAAREGRYFKNKSSEKDIPKEKVADYWGKFKKYFPFCEVGKKAPIKFKGKRIAKIRQNFINYYNARKKFEETVSNSDEKYKEFMKNISEYTWIGKETGGGNMATSMPSDVWKNSDKTSINWEKSNKLLKCTPDQTEKKTQKLYTENKIYDDKEGYCSVVCAEKLEASYDPPKAVSAGVCFEYKITVKSKVECKVVKKGDADKKGWPEEKWPENQGICTVGIMCEEGKPQAGPNDEFDSCVDDCDGGKYSQKCIDKCYKNTYEGKENKDDTKKSVALDKIEKVKPTLLENKDDDEDVDPYEIYIDENGKRFDISKHCYKYSDISKNWDKCAEAFTAAKRDDPMGEYDFQKKHWKPDNDVKKCNNFKCGCNGIWGDEDGGCRAKDEPNSIVNSVKRSAPYYFRNKAAAKSLLQSFFRKNSGYNGAGEARTYVIDNQGVKRQYSANWKCDEDCWITKGSNSSCNDNKDLTKGLPQNDLTSETSKYQKCNEIASDSCSTKMATFYIGAKENKENKKEFEQDTNTPDKKCEESKVGTNDSIFLPEDNPKDPDKPDSDYEGCKTGINNGVVGLCYTGIEDKNYWHYKTTLSFEKTYKDNKTGDVVKDCDLNQASATCGNIGNKYCPKKIAVNQNWAIWKNTGDSSEKYRKENPTPPSVENDENIQAAVGHDKDYVKGSSDANEQKIVNGFGRFNWKMYFICFYGVQIGTIKDDCTPCEDPDCPCEYIPRCTPGPDNPDCPMDCTSLPGTVCPENYEIRTVNPADPFNEESTNNTRNSSVRDVGSDSGIGYNWTSKAKISEDFNEGLTLAGYTIDPQQYLSALKAVAKENKEYVDTNVDYEFTLTPNDMRTYKAYINSTEGGNGAVNSYKNGKYSFYEKSDKKFSYYTSNIVTELGARKRSQVVGKNNE